MRPDRDSAGATVSPARATVFGLDVYAHCSLPFLQGASAEATGRRVELSRHAGGFSALGWPDGAEVISRQLEADRSEGFRIERHADAGYLIAGEGYGAFALSADGRRLRCACAGAEEASWQRLLIAQALPFAAILGGLEVFHASAVVIDGGAVAFVGPSRSGKTSLALELCRLGAGFLADDVLALERREHAVVGHPGTPIAGVDHAEAERLTGHPQTSQTLALNDRERLVRIEASARAAPLSALFFLDRRADGPVTPQFEAVADAGMLLAATFNFVLATPRRLCGLLEVCSLVAQRRVERILVGPAVDAGQLGVAVRRRIGRTP